MQSIPKLARYSRGAGTGEFRNIVISMLQEGWGATYIRNTLRQRLTTQGTQEFSFSNQTISDIKSELGRLIQMTRRSKFVSGDKRPTPVKVGMRFGHRYQYHGEATVRDTASRETYTFPVMFGDDRLLTGAEIRGRMWAVAQQAVDKGFTHRRDGIAQYSDSVVLVKVTIGATQESRDA